MTDEPDEPDDDEYGEVLTLFASAISALIDIGELGLDDDHVDVATALIEEELEAVAQIAEQTARFQAKYKPTQTAAKSPPKKEIIMPTAKQVARTQDALAKAALQQLAIIGGEMTRDEDITFDGRKFVFPEQYQGDLPGLSRFVARYVEGQEEEVLVDRRFDYRPMDGAHAVYHCLKEFFGYAQSKARMGMFGKEPPQEINIAVGYENGKLQTLTVPWGDMVLPGVKNATLTITSTRDREKGDLLFLRTKCRRADKAIIDGFYEVVASYLAANSIYRGRAVNGAMEFFDVEQIKPEMFVYTEDVWAQAETNILSPMRHAQALERHGLSPKRVVLLEGPFGTGKSGLGRTSAKVAVHNGWTAITARPGVDDPFAVMQTARLYQPALVFIEDVDTFSDSLDPNYVTKLLDQFDGFGTKDVRMLLVLTTNHADRIHKGMLRPGRLDAVIHIGNMDRPGVEKLTRLVVRDSLQDDVNFDEVFEATDGFTPAYVKEAIERAVRYTIARTGDAGPIATMDLVHACNSLRAQQALQEAANDSHEKLPPLDQMFRQMVQEESNVDADSMRLVIDERINEKINGAAIVKPGGDVFANVATR